MKKFRVIATASMLAILSVSVNSWAAVGDVDQPDVCYLCHDTVEQQQQLPHVHTAFADGDCSNCHNPHASKHAALLDGEQGALCASCHEDIGTTARGAFAHAPVAAGECSSCHASHSSEHPGQLRMALVDQCESCHSTVESWLDRPLVHAPVASSDCATCHDPHGSGNEALLPGEISETCLSCHEPDAAMTAAHKSPALADSDCTACHDPHSSEGPGLLRSREHGPFASGNCATCHGEMQGRTSFAVPNVRALCERCHQGTKQFADFPRHHNLDEPESCVQCHNPHASNVEALLLKDAADLCASCHFGEPERGKPRADYATHDSMACTECHVPHGGVNENYLRTLEVSLCADCHDSAHQVTHPVGAEIIDPRTDQSVNCLSCHQLHGADFEMYIPLDPTRDLCLQCHRR